jgi:hypothetical protein
MVFEARKSDSTVLPAALPGLNHKIGLHLGLGVFSSGQIV